MIDGIDYYPVKKKRNGRAKGWVLFLLFVAVVAYWYFDNKQNPVKPQSTWIVISEPEIEQPITIIPIVVIPIQDKQRADETQMLENLDEVIQTYNRNNP